LSGTRRKRPKNFKEQIVVQKGYRNIRLEREHVSEFSYRPRKCERSYRVIVLRKSLSVEEGQVKLWEDIRYFFYITNRTDLSAAEVVWLCNERCNQENLIEQLKNGLNALRMPVDNLVSNWSYMVMAFLAWSLKAWAALMLPEGGRWAELHREEKRKLLRMDFSTFRAAMMRVPAQIVLAGRRIVYRLLAWNPWQHVFFRLLDQLRQPLRC
jgi:hypothetical protein